MKNDKYHTFGLTIYYEVNTPKKQKKTIKKMGKKHKNVWITFAFVFQHRKTNVMLDEHEFYVLWNLRFPWMTTCFTMKKQIIDNTQHS